MTMNEPCFIGPRRRGTISHKLHKSGHWSGRRFHMRMTLRISDQPTLDGARIAFHCLLHGEAASGQASTVADCIDAMQAIYEQRTGRRFADSKGTTL